MRREGRCEALEAAEAFASYWFATRRSEIQRTKIVRVSAVRTPREKKFEVVDDYTTTGCIDPAGQ